MDTSFAISPDGTCIAYDVTGEGSALMLLHGGGHSRQNWHDVGYVERLKNDYKVITIDIRGNGESDKRIDPTDYTIEKLCQDILAVADACSVERFSIWGFSYGGNIGRYLAAQSDRVEKLIIMGIPFGLGASETFAGISKSCIITGSLFWKHRVEERWILHRFHQKIKKSYRKPTSPFRSHG